MFVQKIGIYSQSSIKAGNYPKNRASAAVNTSSNTALLPYFGYKPISLTGFKAYQIKNGLNKIIASGAMEKEFPIIEIKPDFIEKISTKIASKKSPLIIGIAGEPASGKTTFLQTIEKNLPNLEDKKLFAKINLDNYYEDLTKELEEHKNYTNILESGYDPHNPKTQNLELARKNILSLIKGETITTPLYIFDECKSIPDGLTKSPAPIVLYEGIFALDTKLADLCDIKIYMQTPQDLLIKRTYERALSRGNSEETIKKFIYGLEESTNKYIRSAKSNADIIIRGNSSEDSVRQLLQEIKAAVQK